MVARKLVYEIVAQYGTFRELHSDQLWLKGGARGVSVVQHTQDKDDPVPPTERWVHRTQFQDIGPVPKSGVSRDEAGVGRARATHPDELPGYASSQQRVAPNMMMLGRQTRLLFQAMYGTPLGPEEEEKTVSEYVTTLQEGLRAAYRHAREGLQRAALHQRRDYDGKVQLESWCGFMTSRWDGTAGPSCSSHGTAPYSSPRCWPEDA